MALHRFALQPLFVATLLTLAGPTASAITTVVARSDAPAPGLAGVQTGTIGNDIRLNASGQVAYRTILAGAGVTSANNQALWVGDSLRVRTGNAAPGTSSATFSALGNVGLSDAGQLVYGGNLVGAGVGSGNNSGYWRDGNLVVRMGDGVPGYANLGYGPISGSMDRQGRINVWAYLIGSDATPSTNQALLSDSSANMVARTGWPAGGLSGVTFNGLSSSALATDLGGTLTFSGTLTGTGVDSSNNFAIMRGNSTVVARTGQAVPALPGFTFAGLSLAGSNSSGQAAYNGYWRNGANSEGGVFRDSTLIARTGSYAGVGSTTYAGDFYSIMINDGGQVGYAATIAGSGVHSANNMGLYRNGTLLARTGDSAAGAAGTVYSGLGLYGLNDGNQALWTGSLSGATVDGTNNFGLWLGDGTDALLLLRRGDALLGSTVTSFSLTYNSALNDAGQVAYQAQLADGRSAAVLYTPELHWRRNYSSNWDATNFSAGLNPGAIHPVILDTAASLTITGPAVDTTVRSLQVGGGSGVATLRMASGRLSVAEGAVQVAANGVLTGDGVIGSSVDNRGTVTASNLGIAGDLNNHGLVNGSGRLNARLLNESDGEVRVGSGELLRLGGLAHENRGNIEAAGGQVQFDGNLTNAGGGRILLDDGTLRFRNGLTNAGQVLVTFGDSSIFGTVLNQTGGRIVVSQGGRTTFYDTVTNQGLLRVSEGGAATFFAQLRGNTTTGSGSVRLEGGWAPGASPGSFVLDNEVYLDSELTMELQGTTPGFCEATLGAGCHDKLAFNNVIDLGSASVLNVVLLQGYQPSAGATYDLFDWGTKRSGRFAQVLLPTLAQGLRWDDQDLYDGGSLRVQAVPEPGAATLLAAGLGLLAWRRRSLQRSAA